MVRRGKLCTAARLRAGAPLVPLLVFLGVHLGGCSLGTMLETSSAVEPEGEPDYRKLIAQGVQGFLPGLPPATVTEVSDLRRSMPVQPGDWIACVRRTGNKDTALFAVFFKSHRIDTVRRAVEIDKCEDATYERLTAAAQKGAAK